MAILHTYPGICQDTIQRIEEGREKTYIDTYYKHSTGFIWWINSKGYYHIYKPEKINTNIGILLSIHKDVAVESITFNSLCKTSK